MMLSVLVHTQSLRFGIPAFIMVGVSPHFFAGWFAWRLLSCVLPRRVYERVDETAYDSYQSLVTYFFETFSGTKLIFYGDHLPLDEQENVVYISNHQSAVDWVVTDLIAIRQETLGRIRYVLKNGLKYLPLYGCYFAQHGCAYVKRGSRNNETYLRRRLQTFVKNKTPIWLVIFPEGTRYDLDKKHVIRASQEFAAQNDLPVLEHVLTPRTRATELSIKELRPHLDALYDVTIAYVDPKKPVLPKTKGKSLTEFLSVGGSEIHIYLERIKKEDIPMDEEDIKEMLFKQFAKKDRLLAHFYGEETAGHFPGKSEELILRTRRTFPYFVFWTGILAATLSSGKGRSLYLKAWSVMGVSSVFYMATLYNWLQA